MVANAIMIEIDPDPVLYSVLWSVTELLGVVSCGSLQQSIAASHEPWPSVQCGYRLNPTMSVQGSF